MLELDDLQLRRNRPGNGHILLQRIGLIHQHVGPRSWRSADRPPCSAAERYRSYSPQTAPDASDRSRTRRGSAPLVGRIEAELAVRMEIEHLRLCACFGGQLVKVPPHIRARLEHDRPSAAPRPCPSDNARRKETGCSAGRTRSSLRRTAHRPDAIAIAARPSAMHPRAFHQRRRRLGIELSMSRRTSAMARSGLRRHTIRPPPSPRSARSSCAATGRAPASKRRRCRASAGR